MKANRLFFAGALMLSVLVSCSVQEEDVTLKEAPSKELVFTATSGEDETKTAFQADEKSIWWSPYDEIAIYYGASGGDKFTSTNTVEVAKAEFQGYLHAFTGQTESGDFNYFWAVYPYSAAVSCDGSSVVADLSNNQIAKAGSFAPNTNITIAKNLGLALSFYNTCAWFRFSVQKEGVKRVIFRGNNKEDIAGQFRVSMGADGRPTAPEVLDGKQEIILHLPQYEAFEVGDLYYITLFPQVFQGGFTVTFETDTETGFRSITVPATYLRSKYNTGIEFDKDIAYVPNIPIPEMVDLGLSVKWASFNLGASSPEEYGDYYAWGETEPYYEAGYAQSDNPVWNDGKSAGYCWHSYKWCDGWSDGLTKYNTNSSFGTIDNKSALDSEDDVAHEKLGGNWRMPTVAEWTELREQCTITWTENYNATGVKGSVLTGPNGNSIFYPAAGYRGDAFIGNKGVFGEYWSLSLNTDYPENAWFVVFDSDIHLYDGSRCTGLSVRPVSE